MTRRAVLAVVLAAFLAVSGCSSPAGEGGARGGPTSAAAEVVEATAAGRAAIGGQWLGSWNRSAVRCGEGGDQFRGYFEQQPSGDQDASERSVRDAWAPYVDDEGSADMVRTDRPGGTMQVLLQREDGFLVLMTVTDSKTSFTATSACFDEAGDVDAEELLPRSEPDVTVF